MPKEEKPRKKMVVEEVSSETPKIEVPSQTEPHIEPGIHEEIKQPVPTTAPPQISQPGPNAFIIIVPGIFLLGALLGGIFFYQTSLNKKAEPIATPTLQAVETIVPIPTPSVNEVDLTKYPISILNGSGIRGEAGKAQTLLEKAGFEISSTGNAESYGYTETTIQIKSKVEKEFLVKLIKSLGENYKVSTKTQSLQNSSKSDVIVIIGNSKT